MESKSLAILVIDENRIRSSIIEAGLRETGHDNVKIVHETSAEWRGALPRSTPT
jgi:response regulator NasT